jgi:hypothetical protein
MKTDKTEKEEPLNHIRLPNEQERVVETLQDV